MADAHRSPFAIALGRLPRQPGVKPALVVLAVVFLLAVYAPVVCGETALFWHDDAGWRLPLLRELFNANTQKIHDLCFNILALLLPVAVLAWRPLRRRWGAARTLRRLGAAYVLLVGVCFIPAPWGRNASLYDQRSEVGETIGAWTELPPAQRPTALFPPVVATPNRPYAGAKLLPPLSPNPVTGTRFLLGTDSDTEDILAGMIHGARISLTIGFVATALSSLIGLLLGAVSGYAGGWIDILIQRLVEIMMCFPTFLLILVVVAIVGPSLLTIVLVIGFTDWAGTARLVRGEYLAHSARDYVLAARALGLPVWRILFVHILPNALTPLLISVTFGVAGTVGMESGLAFIGLGDPTIASWGSVLDQGRKQPAYLWLILPPGVAIFTLVLALNTVGNGLREVLDPKAVPK